jgi:hypothetical protein
VGDTHWLCVVDCVPATQKYGAVNYVHCCMVTNRFCLMLMD